MSEILESNFIDINDNRSVNSIDGFVIKVNRLILLSKSKSLKEFVTKRDFTDLTYDQISKPILKHYSFNKKTLQYEWDDARGNRTKAEDLDLIEIEESSKEELSDLKEKPKKKLLIERRINLRKEHTLILSNRRSIKSYTMVDTLTDQIESIILYQKDKEGFENLTLSDIVNLAVADLIKNYT